MFSHAMSTPLVYTRAMSCNFKLDTTSGGMAREQEDRRRREAEEAEAERQRQVNSEVAAQAAITTAIITGMM